MPILVLSVYSLLTIALLIGIFNPKLVLFQSENPTVWKVVLYWVVSVFAISLFATRFIATLSFYSLPLIWVAILIAGLINPGAILVKSKKPTKLKLAGYWSLITLVIIGLTFSPNRNKKEDLRVVTYEVDDSKDLAGDSFLGIRYVFVKGKIENFGKVAYSGYEITAFFLDDNGNVVEVASTYAHKDIFPGMQRSFLIQTNMNADTEYRRVRLEIENEIKRN